MLYREIIAVCSQIHTKHINTLCGQNVELLNVKPGGTYSDHWALKSKVSERTSNFRYQRHCIVNLWQPTRFSSNPSSLQPQRYDSSQNLMCRQTAILCADRRPSYQQASCLS